MDYNPKCYDFPICVEVKAIYDLQFEASSPRLRLVLCVGAVVKETELNSQQRYYVTTSHLASVPRYSTASTHLKDGKTGTILYIIIKETRIPRKKNNMIQKKIQTPSLPC